jgi:4-amino-4-deoxy-L-arabinose transferase-like glycosyltransferase
MRWSDVVAAALLATAAVLLVWRSPYEASNLTVVPDEVEYAASAQRLATLGRFDIPVDGRTLPPRYPPGFPVLLLAPGYALLGPEPGNGVVPVVVLCAAGILAAYALGRALGGIWGGALAALAVLSVPMWRLQSGRVMSDVPASAFALWCGFAYVRAVTTPARGLGSYAAGGMLAALAAAMRPLVALCALPWLVLALRERDGRRRIAALSACGAPLGAWLASNLVYNASVFGSPFRTGYHFWVPVPSDYAWLQYSLDYVGRNVEQSLVKSWAMPALIVGAMLTAADAWRAPAPAAARSRAALAFLGLFAAPLVAHHLVYFHPEERFLLPVTALAAVLAGGGLGRRLAHAPGAALAAVLAGALALGAAHQRWRGEEVPTRRLAAEQLRALPGDALVVTGLTEPYLEPLVLRGTARRIMPLTRKSEYASKLVAWRRVRHPDPAPKSARDHRCRGLARGGAEEAVRLTVEDDVAGLERELRAGRPVFLQLGLFQQKRERRALDAIRARFALEPAGEELFRLRLPPDA